MVAARRRRFRAGRRQNDFDDAVFPCGQLIEHSDNADQRISVEPVIRTELPEDTLMKAHPDDDGVAFVARPCAAKNVRA
jgi:hypothetical protein